MFKWNNRILAYIVLASFIALVVGTSTMYARDKMDVITIAEELEADELSIEEWSVFARELNTEITTKEEFENKVSNLKREYPEFHWNMTREAASWKVEAVYPHVENNVTEFIRMVTTEEHNHYVTYIIYEVKGTQWREASVSFLQTAFQHNIKKLFQKNPSIFSCVTGSINGNMDSVFAIEMEKLLNLFKAKKIEGVQEENFASVSAHSTLFTQTITDEAINLQVGLRRDGLGSKTRFVIGTPIITFEY
jgi:hypothetical protein